MSDLGRRALSQLAVLAAVMALVLFASAGTLRYWQAWAWLTLFFAASAAGTFHLLARDPALLRRRLTAGPAAETERSQRVIMTLATLAFFALLAVSGLDRRFAWSNVPVAVAIAGDALTVAGFAIIFRVYRENSFAAATIAVAADQPLVTTGPYAIVRHPMYAGGLVMLAGMPPALGSWWGLLALAVMLPALVWRLVDEERLLSRRLPGYAEYRAALRWRLLPGIW